jgi:uroporphyrinogen decarboxylase
MDDPEGVDQLAETRLAEGVELAKRFRDCGVEAVISPSDIADNSGPFFNPEQMRRWILPYASRWAETARAMNMFSILHRDGNLTRYLDDLAGTGLDALQGIDPVAGMDMAQAKATVGDRLCLCGNVDCGLLLLGTPDKVYRNTSELLASQQGKPGFILGASNAVQPEVQPDNYRAMIQAWKDFHQTSRADQPAAG